MLRAVGVSCDEREVDGGLGHAGELDLGLLGRFLEPLQSHLVVPQIYAVLLLERVRHPVDDPLVEVIAAEAVVACRGENFLHAVAHIDDGYIEGAAAQVVYHDLLALFLIHAVGERRGCGLVDDPADVESGDGAGVLCRLTLSVIEVCGHRDDGFRDLLAQICLRFLFELAEDHCGDLLRGIILPVHRYLVVGTHLSLDGAHCSVGVGDSLALCDLSDDALSLLGECDHRRCRAAAFRVGDDYRFPVLYDRNTRVCGAEVYSYNLSHIFLSPFR